MSDGTRPPFEGEHLELDYPCPWGYRVIGEDDLALRAAVATVLGGRDYSVVAGRSSRGGRYVSLEVEVLVESEEQRHAFFHALARQPHIRYVL